MQVVPFNYYADELVTGDERENDPCNEDDHGLRQALHHSLGLFFDVS